MLLPNSHHKLIETITNCRPQPRRLDLTNKKNEIIKNECKKKTLKAKCSTEPSLHMPCMLKETKHFGSIFVSLCLQY